MSIVRLTVPENELICDGKQISFRAPCVCTSLDSVQINDSLYKVVDMRGIPLTQSTSQVFCEGAIISILLDNTSSLAYLQTPALPAIEIVRW